MSGITILPEILSNKIAAGEVVERPASVVKELLENALDAGGTRIFIEVDKGGRSLIRVSDNGHGMNRDDAMLSIERYATSKIKNDADLFSIRTLGFRGEALPSIASVSRFTLETRDEASSAGTRVYLEGGKLKDVSEVGVPVGTQVTVRQLFYNTPARRKFLKTINTEMGHIADIVSSMALGHPEIRFRLDHNGRTLKDWTTTSDPKYRAADVLGGDVLRDLLEIHPETVSGDVGISGWIGSPRVTRNTSRSLFVFVNGRYVQDRVVRHAILDGYGGRLMKGRFPVAIIFITVPPDEVDVNVHPRKSQVRFVEQRTVHGAVAFAVAETLKPADHPGMGGISREPRSSAVSESAGDFSLPQSDYPSVESADPVASVPFQPDLEPPPYEPEHMPMGTFARNPEDYGTENSNEPPEPVQVATQPDHALPGNTHEQLPVEALDQEPLDQQPKQPIPEQTPLWEKRFFGSLRVIGQFRATYILCESSDEGLVLIDQHAAHERVLYEQIKNSRADTRPPVQQLLIPETMDVSFRESAVLDQLVPELNKMGIEIEHFGGNTYVIKAVPALIEGREVRPLIVEIIEKTADIGLAAGMEDAVDACYKLMACHGAIRANQRLSDAQVRELLSQLDNCENPSSCPHGRPTWINWPMRFLEKSFHRIT